MRKCLIIFISFLPLNFIRIRMYRIFLGYKISNQSKIGLFNYLACDLLEMHSSNIGSFNIIQCQKLDMQNSSIGKLNRIRFIKTCSLRKGSLIRSKNSIIGSFDYFSPFEDVFNFEIGENSLLTSSHYFDCPGNIKIGNNVVFGGINSQVWTHGFDINRTMIVGDVTIGNDIYVGSGVFILQNVSICDKVILGAGTIVSKSINEPGFYVSSALLKKSELQEYSNNLLTVEYHGTKFFRK